MKKREKLKYSGAVAAGYDQKRTQSPRWKNEVRVFTEWLQKLQPKTVFDCPFGTGRWIPQYDSVGASVTGVDISSDMLKEASAKIENDDAYTLDCGSIFEYDCSMITTDLVVCVRLVNWLSFPQTVTALENLSKTQSQSLILGCSVRPEGASAFRKFRMRVSLWLKGASRRGGVQYVHDEVALLKKIELLGWEVTSRALIFSNSSRDNFFYLLSRS